MDVSTLQDQSGKQQDSRYETYYRMLGDLALLSSQASMLDLGRVRDAIRSAEYELKKYVDLRKSIDSEIQEKLESNK